MNPATPDHRRALHALGSGTTAFPRLVHYGQDEPRIELSGRVLLNWTAKAANLLLEEFDLQPGDVVALDLPAGHWRAAYWALAAWSLGARVDLTPGAAADVRVVRATGEPVGADAPGGDVGTPTVAVTPAALARRSDVELPDGWIDEAAVLATYGDTAPSAEDVGGDDVALTAGDRDWTFAELAAPTSPESTRRLFIAAEEVPAPPLRAMVSAWADDGLVVVAPASTSAERIDGIAADEMVDEIHRG